MAEQTKPAPSTLAKPEAFRRISSPNQSIACNRPFEYETLPLELMDPSFGIFRDRLEKPPSHHSLDFCAYLVHTACKQFTKEADRMSDIREVFKTRLGLDLHPETITGHECETDGNLEYQIMPALIRECRNNSAYALNQAIAYYAKFLQNVLQKYRSFPTRFPSILMVDMGKFAPLLSPSVLPI